MHRYIIGREVPKIGSFSVQQLHRPYGKILRGPAHDRTTSTVDWVIRDR